MDAASGVLAQVVLHVLETSWQAAVLAVVVVVLGLLLGDRLSARWRCALWLIVVGRLLMPVAPESPLSLFNCFPVDLRATGDDAPGGSVAVVPAALPSAWQPAPTPPGLDDVPVPSTTVVEPAGPVSEDRGPSTWQIASLAWLVGVVVVAVRFAAMLVRLRRLLRRCRPVFFPSRWARLFRPFQRTMVHASATIQATTVSAAYAAK